MKNKAALNTRESKVSSVTTSLLQKRAIKLTYFLFFIIVGRAGAQTVTVTGASGTTGPYATLAAAFADINATAQTGNMIGITVAGNTTEPVTGAVLNAGTWTTMTITPSGGAATIQGNATAGLPLVDFNGADNVTIDGLNMGGNSLTISNGTVSATAGTSTLRFIADATTNTITNCTLLGSYSGSGGGGTIFLSTGLVVGNDTNTISNCAIGPAGTNLPSFAIYGLGSTSTSVIVNSGEIITNNKIYDYFGAAVFSAGIYSGSGCSSWSITINKFYQTATRTWTSSVSHTPIYINNVSNLTGAQGFAITDNIIGYASASQTGVYTLTGSSGQFWGIYYAGRDGGDTSTIDRNSIAAVSMTGVISSGTPFMGINLGGGTVSMTANNIGSQTTLASLVFATNTTTSTAVCGIYNSSLSKGWIATGNQIGGISASNAATSGSFIVYGIRGINSSTIASSLVSNIVGGTISNSISCTSTSTTAQVIGIIINDPTSVTANTIRNLAANGGTGTTTTASVIGISSVSTTNVQLLSQNTIYNLTNTNTTAATTVTGIQFNGGTGNIVERNYIYGLKTASTSASAVVSGIAVSGGSTTFKNNMIALGAGMTNSPLISGISESLGTNAFYHNSIYITGTASTGSALSYALQSIQTAVSRSYMGNILVNTRSNSGGTGFHVAIRVEGTTVNPTGLAMNNNIYYVNSSTSSWVGRFNGFVYATLANWQTAVGQDVNSFFSDPQFVDPTNAIPDLHLKTTVPTVAEGNGLDIGVTDDFDGQARTGLTPVDIGADAGNFIGSDLIGPSIVYTPLGNAAVGTNQTLTVTITDTTGVPTSGTGLPMLYWKLNSGAYTSVQGVWSGGNQYTFTFGSATTAVGDTISYYIVAQDTSPTPLLTAFPNVGTAGLNANPPRLTTAPSALSTFKAMNSYSGTKTICASGCDFSSLTNTGGFFDVVNSGLVIGSINLEVAGDLTSETGTVSLNEFASPYTIKIYPTGSARTISGSMNGNLVALNGADRVTFDGSLGGSGTDRSLTIANTNTLTPAVIALKSLTIGAGCTSIVLKNLNLTAATSTNTSYGIVVGGPLGVGGSGSDNDNVTIQNNAISNTKVGIYAVGTAATSAGGLDNLHIEGNAINSTVTSASYGIRVGNALNSTVNQNSIAFQNASVTGISLETGFISSSVIGNVVSCSHLTTASAILNGIVISTGVKNSSVTVATNTISLVNGGGTKFSGQSFGIGVGSSSSITGGINLYANSINLSGSYNFAGAAFTTALYLGDYASAITSRNNIFSNSSFNNSTSGASTKSYAIYCATDATSLAACATNDYFAAGAQGVLGFLLSDQIALADWKSGTGKDAGSLSANPNFVSATNLHINAALPSFMESAGTAIAGITTDIDGEVRNASTPDIGADEGTFTPPNMANDLSADSLALPIAGGTQPLGISYVPKAVFANTGLSSPTNVTVRYRIVGPSPATSEVYNQTSTIASFPYGTTVSVAFPSVSLAAAGVYTMYAKVEFVGDTVASNDEINGTFTIVDPYVSSTVVQNTASVIVNSTTRQVISIPIVATGTFGTVTSFALNTNGTTAAGTDIANAKLYYTGTTTTFSAINQFGSTVASANGAFTITGSRALVDGTNYFWLTYDVLAGAMVGNVIDAECTGVTVNGNSHVPTVTGPIGVKNIVGAMSGTYLIGASQTYPNFISLTSALTDLNMRGVSGATYFELESDYSATETFPLTINSVVGASNINTITIKPAAGVSATIAGDNATTLLDFSGVKYVTLDGSNSVGGTSRNLTFSNTNTSGAVVRLINDATNNMIMNTVLKGVSIGSNGVVYFANTTGTTGNDSNTIKNNEITAGLTAPSNGIYNSGSTTTSILKNSGNAILGNSIYNFSNYGIYDNGGSVNTIYSNNQIYETITQTTSIVGFSPRSTSIEGFVFDKNRIYDLKTSGTSAEGIEFYDVSSTIGTGVVSNNMIALDYGTSVTVYGIYENGTSSEHYSIFNNSISISGVESGSNSSYVYFRGVSSLCTVRNNIFSNTRTGGTGKHYAYYNTSSTAANLTSDHNDIYAGGGTGNVLGRYGSNDIASISTWQSTTGKDVGSISANPQFVGTFDLHINTTLPAFIESTGIPIAGITTDYDGDTRSTTTPDLGADEGVFLIPVNNDISTTSLVNPTNLGTISVGTSITPQATYRNIGIVSQSNIPVRYRIVGPSPATTEIYNQSSTISSLPSTASLTVSFPNVVIALPGSYTVYAKAELVGDSVPSNDELSGTFTVTDPFVSATTTQNTGSLIAGLTNQQIIGIQVVTSGTTGILTSLSLTTAGTTAPLTDISNAKVYYTGATNTFSAVAQFGTTLAAPNGSFVLNGSRALVGGTNYFWLVYDITAGANPGDIVDAAFTSVTVNGLVHTPTITDPTGSRTIYGPMSGTYLVGAGQTEPNFVSLTAAVADLNLRGVNGATKLELQSDYTSALETFPINLNAVTGASSEQTITIKPGAGVTATLAVSSGYPAFYSYGGTNFVIDGSNTVGGTSRDLTVNCINSNNAVNFYNASYNQVKNMVIKAIGRLDGQGRPLSNEGVVYMLYCNYNLIQNNEITSGIGTLCSSGIYNTGSSGSYNTGNRFIANTIHNFSTQAIYEVYYTENSLYQSNEIFDVPTGFAIRDVSSLTIKGFTFDSNKIYQVPGSSTIVQYGMYIWGLSPTTTGVISNNMISLNDNNTNYSTHGIGIINNSGLFKIYHNTISITGTAGTAGGVYPSSDICYGGSTSGLNCDFRNNIFSNMRFGGAIFNFYNLSGISSNTNDIYSAPNSYILYLSAGYISTFSSYQSYTGLDANSVSILPVFATQNNLHLTTANATLDNLGTPLAGITTDIDGVIRSTTTPDIGAAEFSACAAPTLLSYTVPTVTYCTGTTISSNVPSFSGGPALNYTVSPSLPAGLNLDTSSGTISGTPTAATASRVYTISVSTTCGSTTVALTIGVDSSTTYYADRDGDGFGDLATPLSSCSGAPTYLGHVAVLNSTDCNDNVYSLTNSCYSLVALKLFIEGYYDKAIHGMRSVKMNQGLNANSTDVADITLELRDPTTYAIVDSAVATLQTDGTVLFTFATAPSGSFYLVVKGSNFIQTWVTVPQTVGSALSSYDFTTDFSKAYGDNMVEVEPGVWALYSGDIAVEGAQDGNVDTTDFAIWETDYANFVAGGPSDLNGDGNVDTTDFSIWENNYANFVSSLTP